MTAAVALERRTQQMRLYAAERTVSDGRKFADIAEVQRWLDGLRESWWWERWLPELLRIEAGWGHPGHDAAGVGGYDPGHHAGRVEFDRSVPLTEQLLVHEIAHVVAHYRFGRSCGHSPWFARIYAELTYLIRGPEAWQTLTRAFDRHGIDYDAAGLA